MIEVDIACVGDHGDGIADVPGGRLYVALTAIGDRVRVRPAEARGDGRTAELVEVLRPGPGRITPPCGHFGRCGGCSLQHMDDALYAAWKVERLHRALRRAGLSGYDTAPLARTPAGQRRRATFVAERCRGSTAVALGFNVRRGHDVVDLTECPVIEPRIMALLPGLRALLATLLADRQRARIAVALLDGSLDVVLEWPATPSLETRQRLADFAEAAGLARLSWRRGADEEPAEPIAQRAPVSLRCGDATSVAVPPGAFVQASAAGEAALVAAVRDGVGGAASVVDLFAGIGTFAFALADRAKRVHAVEADAEAVRALTAAAATRVGASRVTGETRDLFRRPLLAAELCAFEAVVVDPPRAGAKAQAAALAAARVAVVVAVSCNPDTFARDAALLAGGGYRLTRVFPVDQFLWSPHLEAVGHFRRA